MRGWGGAPLIEDFHRRDPGNQKSPREVGVEIGVVGALVGTQRGAVPHPPPLLPILTEPEEPPEDGLGRADQQVHETPRVGDSYEEP